MMKGAKPLRQHDRDGVWDAGDRESQHAFASVRSLTYRLAARSAEVPGHGDGGLPRQSTAKARI